MLFTLLIGLASRIYVWIVAAAYEAANATSRPLLAAMCQWDCHWYRTIMIDGYHPAPISHPLHTTSDPANWAFFPVFPKLAATVGGLISNNITPPASPPIWRGPLTAETPESMMGPLPADLVGAFLVNHLAFMAGLCVLYLYAQLFFDRILRGGHPEGVRYLNAAALPNGKSDLARSVVLFAAFSPFSFYFSAPMTESLYFLTTVTALYLARTDRWLAAGAVAAVASATRNLGVSLVFSFVGQALGACALLARDARLYQMVRVTWAIALAPLGLFLYMYYLRTLTGDPLAFMHIQHAWGGETLGNPFVKMWSSFWAPGFWGKLCTLSALVGLYAAWTLARAAPLEKKVPRTFISPEAWLLVLGTLIPFSLKANSMYRYVLTLFPVFLVMGVWTLNRPKLRMVLLGVSALLLAHFTGAWLRGAKFTA